MENSKNVLILGGGYAGVEAAKIINKRFRKNDSVTVTLIDKNPYHTLMTELHEVAGARVEPESVQVSFRKIFGGSDVRVVMDNIEAIDFQEKKLKSADYEYSFDYLVLGAGGEPEFFGIPGVKANAFTLWSLEDALSIREHTETMFREAAREQNPEKRRELLTFAVAGAGFTGIEMAGELMERRKDLCLQYGIEEDEVRIVVVEALDDICMMLRESMRKKAARYMQKKRIEILLNSPITEAAPGQFTLKDGTVIKSKTLIWTCGIQGCEFAGNLSLTKGRCANRHCSIAMSKGTCGSKHCQFRKEEEYISGKRGRLLVRDTMQSADYDNVYIVGDVAWYMENEKVIPQIVETALQTAETAAHNIIADIDGKDKRAFKSNYHGFMVSIGGRYGVADVAGLKLSGFFAMVMKHFINVHYLWGLAGVNAVWGYLRHEFFRMKNGRSIVGSHASATVHAYWAVPLRIFVGAKWFIEGLKKILNGWLKKDNVFIVSMAADGTTAATPGAAAYAEPSADAAAGATQAAAEAAPAAADAVTAATDAGAYAVEETVEAVTAATDAGTYAAEQAADVVQQAADAVTAATGDWVADAVTAATGAVADAVTGATAGGGAAWEGVKPLLAEPWIVYKWIEQTIIVQAPMLFQSVVVLAEVALGLALIGGLFTFLSAGATILLSLMFIVSAMTGPDILWYIFAAIVLMGGAGKAFGLDHWVLPFIKKWWNRTRFAKRTFLYVDEPVNAKRKKAK